MASSIVNFFKRKQNNKQQNGYEIEQKFLHRGKPGSTSFRLPLYRKHSPPERNAIAADDGNAASSDQQNSLPYKSPYDVVTEPKKKRAIRSCPGGSNHRNSGTFFGSVGKFGARKFSPPIETILEQSGSYENFPPPPSSLVEEEEAAAKCPQNHPIRRKMQMRTKPEHLQHPQLHMRHLKRNMGTRNSPGHPPQQFDGRNGHPSHNYQQMSTSEYGSGSTEPSPINDQFQGHHSAHQASFMLANNLPQYQDFRNLGMPAGDSSDDEEEEEDSSEEDRLSISLLQFWQHQVKLSKKEVRHYREEAEKYRSKYIRAKSHAEELAKELTREKERSRLLVNQLLFAKDKIIQTQFQNQQQQSNNLAKNGKQLRGLPEHLGGQMNIGGPPKFSYGSPFLQGGAGEVQCPINEVQGESNSSPPNSDQEYQNFHHSSPLNPQQQFGGQQNYRPPTLFGNNSSFLNYSRLSADLLGLEQPRNEEQQNGEIHDKSSTFSPMKPELAKMQKEGHNQLVNEEDEPIIVSLDQCINYIISSRAEEEELTKEMPQRERMKTKFGRLSFSSDDLASLLSDRREKSNISSMLSSSDDDMAKLWTRQLVKKGERVLFRPPRRSLFLGPNDQRETAKALRIFKRYGKSEREAMSTFDYLGEEKSDVSGLMSSPEKAT